MKRSHWLPGACALLLLAAAARDTHAQEAVVLTGRVTAEARPVQGAAVRIEELGLGGTTNADGRYSFIVPSTRVRGQSVALTVRHVRYGPQSVQVQLRGGPMVHDFQLLPVGDGPARPEAGPPVPGHGSDTVRSSAAGAATLHGAVLDTAVHLESVGVTDVPAMLAGRIAGVEVRGPATFGGVSSLRIRGPRSLFGDTEPLYVIDGVLMENATVNSAAQRHGLGGFDYGSGIADIDPADIASVRVLRGPEAAALYGGRGANGVVVITTRDAARLNGFVVSATQLLGFEAPLRLPDYQDDYGQGLAGEFAFFDGRGGGINDSVSQSWGPALDGRPLTQASLLEAGRPDVRFWTPQPDNVSGWFESGRALATSVAAQGGNGTGHVRLSLGQRTRTGITPGATLTRRSAAITSGLRPGRRFGLDGSLQLHQGSASGRPGTGVDEGNTIAMFSRLPRQVDVEALRVHLRDADSSQVSWNYAGRNNPYFAALLNSNDDDRTHWLGGATARFDLTPGLRATAQVGTDRVAETRRFDVARGWMGGFPYAGGRGDFMSGGFQEETVESSSTNGDFALRATTPASGAVSFAFTAGAGMRATRLASSIVAADALPAPTASFERDLEGSGRTTIVRGGVDALFADYAAIRLGARREASSLMGGAARSQVYPSVTAHLDVEKLNRGLRPNGVDHVRLHGGWGRSGNEVVPAVLYHLGLLPPAGAATDSEAPAPEVTTGWELGARAEFLGQRVGLDATVYGSATDGLLMPSSGGGEPSQATGSISNRGIELGVHLVPVRAGRVEWRVDASYARNDNEVVSLPGGVDALTLAPGFGGVSIEARPGHPVGAIVGTSFLRDAAGALVLRDGLPQADTEAGAQVLGSGLPDWTGGVSSAISIGGIELSVLFDVRRGGQVFSATNLMGATAGVLAETAFRPDSGLLIDGIDVATGARNDVHVSTEAYYRALGSIGERWVYDASYAKLREARVAFTVPLRAVPFFRAQSVRAAIVGRNLALWTDVPGVDPDGGLAGLQWGAEMGQHPSTRSLGVQITLTP